MQEFKIGYIILKKTIFKKILIGYNYILNRTSIDKIYVLGLTGLEQIN
jgi:hypothetical protein